MIRRYLGILAALLTWSVPDTARAAPALQSGDKTITIIGHDGSRLNIGKVTFAAKDTSATFKIKLDAPEFSDEFLSMRPFRCLSGTKEMWCHLEYPYEMNRSITATDLTDLEYSLLFLFKPPSGYGIDAWNGLYFKLALADDGAISGALHEVDLNILATPPESGNLRPISGAALTPVARDAHRYWRLEIR